MTVVAIICVVLIAAGAILALVRVERGPSMLDRTVGLDVFTAALVGAIAVEAAYSQRVETVPLLVVLSLVGFIGSVTISRFAAVEPKDQARVRTAEELAAENLEDFELPSVRHPGGSGSAQTPARSGEAVHDASVDGEGIDPDGRIVEPEDEEESR